MEPMPAAGVPGHARRTVVVDDDDLSRRGIVALLASDGRFEVTADFTHDVALASPGWEVADLVVVDAADTRREDDHFIGVQVVERVRATRPSEATTVVVITGHFFDDALRWRMREAGADLFFYRRDVQDANVLLGLLADPDHPLSGVPDTQDPEAVFRHGVTRATRVNDAVDFARDRGWLAGELARPGRRSRSWDRVRGSFARTSRLNAVNTDGTPPDRDQDEPSRPQIARFLDWATKAKHP
jgi:CheY-like chemotaxis protein